MNKTIFLLVLCILTGCETKSTLRDYAFKSYLEIELDKQGRMPMNPYPVEVKRGKNELCVLGVMHSQDTTNMMFAKIEEEFNRFNPEIVIHEGGEILKTYKNKNQAISKDGELGLIKYLCEEHNVKLKSGDINFRDEFEELEKIYGREKTYFYYTTERFILPIKYWGTEEEIEKEFRTDFIEGYINSSGIILTKKEKNLDYYKMLYKRYFKREFKLQEIEQKDFSSINEGNEFCEISRSSKRIRDKKLIQEIEKEIDKHERVMVVFGGWHIMSIEPELLRIFEKKK